MNAPPPAYNLREGQMLIALVIWNVILTVLVLYVVAGYLWHINMVHVPDNVRGKTK